MIADPVTPQDMIRYSMRPPHVPGYDDDGPYEDNPPVKCPTCNFPGYVGALDQRGLLIRHPGRAWPCRVQPGTEAPG